MVSLIVGLSVVAFNVATLIYIIVLLNKQNKKIEQLVNEYKGSDKLLENHVFLNELSHKLSELIKFDTNTINDSIVKKIDEVLGVLREPVIEEEININDIQMKEVDESLYGAKKSEVDSSEEENFVVEEVE